MHLDVLQLFSRTKLFWNNKKLAAEDKKATDFQYHFKRKTVFKRKQIHRKHSSHIWCTSSTCARSNIPRRFCVEQVCGEGTPAASFSFLGMEKGTTILAACVDDILPFDHETNHVLFSWRLRRRATPAVERHSLEQNRIDYLFEDDRRLSNFSETSLLSWLVFFQNFLHSFCIIRVWCHYRWDFLSAWAGIL